MLPAQEQWLPELLRIVGIINTSFSHNFRDIGCAGEVSLGVHGVPSLASLSWCCSQDFHADCVGALHGTPMWTGLTRYCSC